ncbi:MAG TPA: coenzyme F420-0:L-glutamate ligase [Candidatus Saccharimonadales bacterium]|nr:coenzyme F420-0:L-glutamate ligase [Candidatus Saccharimonadales bacterium]
MKIKAVRTTIFKPNENLISFIEKYFPIFTEKSILVVTSKIIALAEGRLVKYIDEKNKVKIIKGESDLVIKTKYVYLTIKDGTVMANAGVDESNADGHLILLPEDSFKSAFKIRKYFCDKHRLKNFGVIITDSRCLLLRAGVVGIATGYAGFKGLKEYQGKLDIFKRPFVYERVDVVDSLATAAVLCMGEGDEKKPLALINEAPVEYSERVNKNELKIDIKEDMYGPLFRRIK